jgi:hypothetical protein
VVSFKSERTNPHFRGGTQWMEFAFGLNCTLVVVVVVVVAAAARTPTA